MPEDKEGIDEGEALMVLWRRVSTHSRIAEAALHPDMELRRQLGILPVDALEIFDDISERYGITAPPEQLAAGRRHWEISNRSCYHGWSRSSIQPLWRPPPPPADLIRRSSSMRSCWVSDAALRHFWAVRKFCSRSGSCNWRSALSHSGWTAIVRREDRLAIHLHLSLLLNRLALRTPRSWHRCSRHRD